MTGKSIASRLVTYLGIGIIGVLAVPAGVLVGLISLIWSFVDFAIRKLNK